MKNGIINTALFLIFFWMFFSFNKNYILNTFQPESLSVSFEFKVSEDDIFQLFYRNPTTKFSEENSETQKVNPLKGYQKMVFHLPDSLSVSHLRFDFGNKFRVSPITFKTIKFSYNGNVKIIDSSGLEEYFKPNSYTEASGSSYQRKIIGMRSDPFFSSIDLQETIAALKKTPNYRRLSLNIILSLLLAFSSIVALRSYLAKNKVEEPILLAFVICFFFTLMFPHLDEAYALDDTATTEKRDLLEMPILNAEGLEEYPVKFENYYNENFGFRKKMVSLSATLKVKIFDTSPKSERVVVGKEGWLFYWKDVIRKSYLNENPFQEKSLGGYGKIINEVNDFMKTQNRIFMVTVYPNKHSIYEEYIPNRFKKLKKNNIKRIDGMYDFLNVNSILNVDHRELLKRKTDKGALYLKNDSHWNSLGAYYAYENIINILSEEDSTVMKPLSINQFQTKTIPDYKKGDLLDLLGIDNSKGYFNDTYIKFTPNRKIRTNKKMNVYGNSSFVIDNLDAENEATILFFGDSFSYELLRFMPAHFKKTIFIRNINLDKALIEKIDPSIIVYGIVERNLEYF